MKTDRDRLQVFRWNMETAKEHDSPSEITDPQFFLDLLDDFDEALVAIEERDAIIESQLCAGCADKDLRDRLDAAMREVGRLRGAISEVLPTLGAMDGRSAFYLAKSLRAALAEEGEEEKKGEDDSDWPEQII